MGRPKETPRIIYWRRGYYAFYLDYETGKRVRKSCLTFDPPARTKEERLELLRGLTIDDKETVLDQLKGQSVKTAFGTPLVDSLRRYLHDVASRVKVKQDNPNADGLSEKAAGHLERSIGWFIAWLEAEHPRITTGELSANTLKAFMRTLASGQARRGAKKVTRSAYTLNSHRLAISAALHWIKALRPKQFLDFDDLIPGIRLQRVDHAEPAVFTPDQMRKFYDALLEREQPGYAKVLTPRPGTRRKNVWTQPCPATCATPQSFLFLLLACTGARLGEALKLKWSDVDLQRGRVTIRASKTGRRRVVPLLGAPEGEVAPQFARLLQEWKLQAGDREYVLPHRQPRKEDREPPVPTFERRAWEAIAAELGLRSMTPQALRQNFCAYCGSMGVPEVTASQWLGHSVKVAERFYRSQVLERNKGATSLESAMGLGEDVQRGERGTA